MREDERVDALRVGLLPAPGEGRLDALSAALRRLPRARLVLLPGSREPAPATLAALISACPPGGGAVGGRAVRSTVKEVRDALVVRTRPRDALISLDGPRVFERAALEAALSRGAVGAPAGDDEVELALGARLPLLVVRLDTPTPGDAAPGTNG